VRRSGQRGVPVITVDDAVIVGFDRARLHQALAQARARRSAQRLGLAVADARRHGTAAQPGAYVGRVTPGSPAARAGIAVSDTITRLDGQPVGNAAELEQIRARLQLGSVVPVELIRAGTAMRVLLQL
jgi:S1-C subfamily serine protease